MAEPIRDFECPQVIITLGSRALANPGFKGSKTIAIASQARWHHSLPVRYRGAIPKAEVLIEEIELLLEPFRYHVLLCLSRLPAEHAPMHALRLAHRIAYLPNELVLSNKRSTFYIT